MGLLVSEWLIPTPVEVIPGKREPVGVAGPIDAAGHQGVGL